VPRIFFSVAEPSADENVALVVRELRASGFGVASGQKLSGIGGAALRAAGVDLLQDTVASAAMGFSAISRVAEVSKLLGRVSVEWDQSPPDLVVCSDSWSLNIHIARLARKRKIPVLWYVAPQTWASREGRVKQLAQVTDLLACILPFEESYFRRHGINAHYVGHPLWDRIRVAPPSPAPTGFLGDPGRTTPPVVGVLPGSRKGVVRANWPRLQQVMDLIRGEIPGVRFRIPISNNIAGLLGPLPPDVEAKPDAMDDLIGGVGRSHSAGKQQREAGGGGGGWQGCDLCLCVSGTAALHVAAHRVPLLVVYHGNPLLWHLLGRWVVRTRTYSLVNLLSGRPDQIRHGHYVAPEYIPWYGSVKPVADHAIRLLQDPAKLASMRSELAGVVRPLESAGQDGRGASARVAGLILDRLKQGPSRSPAQAGV
jgi:lipid-A-disaccharide synthase